MGNVKAAFISFGFFAYPMDFIKENSMRIFTETKDRGLDMKYFGPVIDTEDSKRIAEELKTEDFDFIIAHTTTWTMSPVVLTVLGEFRDVPVLVWGMGGMTEKGTLISPASAAGTSGYLRTLRQFGIKYRYVYDHPDAQPKYDEVMHFANIIKAIKALRGARVGAMGYCDMGLYSLMLDGIALKKQLGMDVEDIFSFEIGKIAEEAPLDEVGKVIEEMKRDLRFDSEPTDEELEKTARLTYALRKKASERKYLGITIKCVYGVSRYMGFTPCLTQALLAKEITSICESDTPGLVTNVILKLLTGQSATFMENYEYYENKALVGVCGFAPFDMTYCDRVKCMNAGWGGFTGLYVTEEMKAGKVTVARLFSEDGRLKMLLLTADAEIPGKWAELGWAEPMPKFPSMLLTFNCPLDFYIESLPAQHINIVYGDYTREIREFCKLTDIEVIEFKG